MSFGTELRRLTANEIVEAVSWAASEGWNPGHADASTFLEADPQAFLGSFDDRGMAACVSVAEIGAGYGFLGFYICRPDRRGQGLGFALWQAALASRLIACIGLDGVVDQQENYRRSGFAYAHANHRYGGLPEGLRGGGTRPYDPAMAGALARYDTRVFGVDRAAYLAAWLGQSGARIRVAEQDGIRGWGLARPCLEGHKIGPLFADDAATAEALLSSLSEGLAGPVFLDVPGTNPEAIVLAKKAGLSPVFETARMYRGAPPPADLARTFGITSFEFG
ncbi:MAG: GNAT family N-acetyltransferase [Pseudomonadota bacterium]